MEAALVGTEIYLHCLDSQMTVDGVSVGWSWMVGAAVEQEVMYFLEDYLKFEDCCEAACDKVEFHQLHSFGSQIWLVSEHHSRQESFVFFNKDDLSFQFAKSKPHKPFE